MPLGHRPIDLRGCSSELIAAAAFLNRGYEVYWPAVHSGPVDMLVRRERHDWSRVQVKTAYLRRETNLRVHTCGFKYTASSFDIFAAVDPSGLVWVTPWTKSISRRKTLSLLKDMVRL